MLSAAIDKLKQDARDLLLLHHRRIDEYLDTRAFKPPREEIQHIYQNHLATIMATAADSANIQLNWKCISGNYHCIGNSINLIPDKIKTPFTFGIYNYAYYLSSPLSRSSLLLRVKDDFWELLCKLTQTGECTFQEYTPANIITNSIGKIQPKKYNSVITQILYNLASLSTPNNHCVDFGEIEIQWPITTEIDVLIQQLTKATKYLYSMQYKLYRIEYQTEHAKNKRQSQKSTSHAT